MTTETRLDQVEQHLAKMSSRIRRLEIEAGVGGSAPPVPARSDLTDAPVTAPASRPEWFEPSPSRSEWSRPRPVSGASFEELFGGRVLAWIGSLAILLGAVLFLGMAISHGWLDETARTLIAAAGSIALLFGGVWLHERKGRAEAARAAVASAISGLYATLIVATQSYDLISSQLGLVLAALVAAAGLPIAVRWSSPIVATIGSLGALGAPVLVGTGPSGASIAFVAVALIATVGILLWQRWDWLALGAFAVSAPQLIAWILANDEAHVALVLLVLVGFWAVYAGGAFGYELRTRAGAMLPVASLLLLFGSSALVVLGGFHVLDGSGNHTAAVIWLFGFAAVQLVLGGLAMRLGIHREIGSLLIGVGIAVSAFAFAEALDGPGLVVAWAAESAALAFLATRVEAGPGDGAVSSAERLLLAAGAFLVLALGHVLAVEAPPSAIFEGVDDLGAAVAALAACAAGALACGHFARRIHPAAAQVAAFAGAGALVYLGSVLIVDTMGVDAAGEARQAGQVWLSAFWTVTGLAAVVWGLVRRSAGVRLGGLALLGIAIVKVWTYDLAELDELARVLSFVGLGLLLLVGAFAYQRIRPGEGAGAATG